MPQEIISNNRSHFEGEVRKIIELYKIEHHKSSPYQLETNGTVEAANKNVKNILSKTVVTYKDWVEKIPFALWGYRTFIPVSTRVTPYSLMYGSEVVLPIEMEIQYLRLLVNTRALKGDWIRERYGIDEKRM